MKKEYEKKSTKKYVARENLKKIIGFKHEFLNCPKNTLDD